LGFEDGVCAFGFVRHGREYREGRQKLQIPRSKFQAIRPNGEEDGETLTWVEELPLRRISACLEFGLWNLEFAGIAG
jgi:hypothetical protein